MGVVSKFALARMGSQVLAYLRKYLSLASFFSNPCGTAPCGAALHFEIQVRRSLRRLFAPRQSEVFFRHLQVMLDGRGLPKQHRNDASNAFKAAFPAFGVTWERKAKVVEKVSA